MRVDLVLVLQVRIRLKAAVRMDWRHEEGTLCKVSETWEKRKLQKDQTWSTINGLMVVVPRRCLWALIER